MINILNLDNRYKIVQLLRLLITKFNIIGVYVKGDNISITTSNIENVDGLKYNRSSSFTFPTPRIQIIFVGYMFRKFSYRLTNFA